MIEITASASDEGKPFAHFWSVCVGAGRANEGLRASWQRHLREAVAACGFRYIRFHGLFHDDMFVYREDEGKPIYNFQYIDDLFDALLEIGIRPFVELGFCPRDLASQKETVFWWKGHGSPPLELSKWRALIRRTTQHWIDRYGVEEVRRWYFEVWNEPNLHPFFKGTRSQYFELYKATVQELKQLDNGLRVGGPSTSNFVPDERFEGETEDISQHRVVVQSKDLEALSWRPVWLAQFFDYCEHEKLPVDFVSVHPYPTDWALDEMGATKKLTRGVNATREDLTTLRGIIDASCFPNAEIHLTEWSSSPSPRDFTHDYLQAATYIIKVNIESIGLADSLSYWTFTDIFEESGAGDSIFHGGFGMLNYQGLAKPSFHAYRFLNRLGNQMLFQCSGAILTKHSGSGMISGIAFNYPKEMSQTIHASFDSRATAEADLAIGTKTDVCIRLSDLAPQTSFRIETLDTENGNVMSAWQAMGSPDAPTREQLQLLHDHAAHTMTEIVRCDNTGRLFLRKQLAPWSVMLIDQIEH